MNADGFAPGGDTIQGRFATTTDDSIKRLAKRVQLPVDEVRAVIREVRWREAREWLANYVRPWLYKIHDAKSARYAIEHMPPEWITGDKHIDAVAGAYATNLVEVYTRLHEEKKQRDKEITRVLPPIAHKKRCEIRQAKNAARKAMKKRIKRNRREARR